MAQEVVAMKCGVLMEDKDLDNTTLQQYLDLYKHPLTDFSIEAITKLSEVAAEKKKKKREDKKKKKEGDVADGLTTAEGTCMAKKSSKPAPKLVVEGGGGGEA
jgi:hypothetical protein